MARGKHAAALFEVISSSKRDTGIALRTPKWWFKSRDRDQAQATAAVAPERIAPRIAEVESLPDPVSRVDPTERYPDPDRDRAPALGRSAVRLHVDHDRHELTLHLRFTTAIVAGFAVLVSIGLAYVMGRHVSGGPRSASASEVDSLTNDDLQQRPTQPSALDVPRRATRIASSHAGSSHNPEAAKLREAKPAHAESGPLANQGQSLTTAPAESGVARVKDLHYIIAQTYANEKSAQEACDFLNKIGIPCTVEKAPPGFGSEFNWFSVITVRSFEHVKTGEFDAYRDRIRDANAKFAPNAKFKRFEPAGYRWR